MKTNETKDAQLTINDTKKERIHTSSEGEKSNKNSYLNITLAFHKEALPFLLIRMIELGVDFSSMMMLARYNSETAAAGSLITSSQILIRSVNAGVIFFTGVMVSGENAKNKPINSGSILQESIALALLLSVPAISVSTFIGSILKFLSQPVDQSDITQDYMRGYAWGIPSTFVLISNQQFLIALKKPYIVLTLTAIFKPLKLLLGYFLIFGKLGLPELGAAGLGYADSISSSLNLAGFLILYLCRKKEFEAYNIFKLRIKENLNYLLSLIKKGIPIGIYTLVEIGSLIFAAFLFGRKGKIMLAAFQPALQYGAILAYTSYSLAHSEALLVRDALKREDIPLSRRISIISSYSCLVLPVSTLIAAASFPKTLLSAFMQSDNFENKMILIARNLLYISISGEIFDGLRNAFSGALRGIGDTSTPMRTNILTALLINIIPASIFDFGFGWGAEAIFTPRALSIAVGSFSLFIFMYRKILKNDSPTPEKTGLLNDETSDRTPYHALQKPNNDDEDAEKDKKRRSYFWLSHGTKNSTEATSSKSDKDNKSWRYQCSLL